MKKYVGMVFILVTFILSSEWVWTDNLKIHFIDVREGDAMLMQYEGENYLIDSGRNLSSNKLINYVDSVGANHIDACMLTHPDFDHYGEFEDFIESGLFVIERFIVNKDINTNITYVRLMNLIQSENIPIDSVDYMDDLNWSMTTDILSPNYDNGFSGNNNNSIVIKMNLGAVEVLLTGDSETDNNQYLLDEYDLDVEVLKVSHHGAYNGTNEAFLDEVTPVVSVISSGNNSYGHPDSVVVGLLEDSGSFIYSTADDWNTWWYNGSAGSDDTSLDDDIVVETDGNSIWVDGELVWQNISVDEEFEGSLDFRIDPNPFQDTTRIKYSSKLLTDLHGSTQIKIFNVKGKVIKKFKTFPNRGLGTREVVWDGKDEYGNRVSAGVYFVKIESGGEVGVRKVVVLSKKG